MGCWAFYLIFHLKASQEVGNTIPLRISYLIIVIRQEIQQPTINFSKRSYSTVKITLSWIIIEELQEAFVGLYGIILPTYDMIIICI